MRFTFGIITGGSSNLREDSSDDEVSNRINNIINSIQKQKIKKYEIIIVGGKNYYQDNLKVKHIEFDEQIRRAWITKKKNIITQEAVYENIVYMHDYFSLADDWYENILKFGDNFDIQMNKIIDINGNRFHDWTLCPDFHPIFRRTKADTMKIWLPYDVSDMNRYQYISGGFWIAKKDIMKENPLNENLCWGQAEDVEWSKRVLQKYKLTMNQDAVIMLNKPRFANDWTVIDKRVLDFLRIKN